MGAADYITKPFSQKLLSERIRTVLRIYQNRKAPTTQENTDFKNLKKGNLELDDLKQLCYWKNEIVELTVAEFNLIKSLAKYPGGILHTGFTQPPQCMPDEYKVEGNSVKAYWNYYINDKKTIINKNEKPYTKYPFDCDRYNISCNTISDRQYA